MKNEKLLLDNYLNNNYEKYYLINKSKYDLICILSDKFVKYNSYIEKFIKEKMENKIMKDKLSTFEEEENFHSLFLLIQNSLDTNFNSNYKMFNEILEVLNKLKHLFKEYFKKYEDFINCQKKFIIKLNEIEILKTNFLSSAEKAESFTYKFIKKKVFNIKSKNKNEFQEKEEFKKNATIDLNKYKDKLKEGDNELKLFNKFQRELFESEKDLEIKYNESYSDCLMQYVESQSLLNSSVNKIKDKIVNLNEKSNKKKLKDYLDNYNQKDEIDFIQYQTHIEFSRCKEPLELSACFMAYNELAQCIGKYEDIEFLDETKKLEVNNEINRILHLDEKITDEDSQKILDIVKTHIGQKCFITSFSLLRANGIYEKSEKYLSVMTKTINLILENAEKEKNYEIAKNCIILSQTFYYLDLNKNKIYIFRFIKNNKWLKSADFWRPFIDYMLKKEFERASKFKKKNFNDLLLTQLLPYINNMKEFGLGTGIIIKIVDEYIEKYNYLKEENKKTIFSLICDDYNEVEKYRKEYKENPNLEKALYEKNYKDNKNEIIEEENEQKEEKIEKNENQENGNNENK